MKKEFMNREAMMDLEEEIYFAYIQTLDWSLCDYDPESFISDYFDEDDYLSYREWCFAMIV